MPEYLIFSTDVQFIGAAVRVSYSRGLIYALLSGVFLSSGGLMARFLDAADPWTVLFYRSLAFFATVLLFMFWRYRGELIPRLRQIQARDLLVSVFLSLGFMCYLMSLYYTSVANTVLLLSTGPFFAALLGLLILGEKVTRTTWLAMTVAMAGVVIMISGDVSADDAVGMLLAVMAVLSYACMLVVLRSAKEHGGQSRELLPATALAGLLTALCSVPMIDSFVMSHSELALSICFGTVQVGAGFILITLAAKVVPAAQVALLGLTETALAPVWVWLVFTETPGDNTLIGGLVIVAAVLYNGIAGVRNAAPQVSE